MSDRTDRQMTCTAPLSTGMPGDRCEVCGWVVPPFPEKRSKRRKGATDE